jgi:hypothetical protein
MQLIYTLSALILGSAMGANACSWYYDCKCHESANKDLQNDAATKTACEGYFAYSGHSGASYQNAPRHQARIL